MSYIAQDFQYLIGLAGFSETLLRNHFTLYQGYVANVNKLLEKMPQMEKTVPEYAELKRRFAWEWNGMRLHELYFENLGKEAQPLEECSKLAEKIKTDFGSYANWEADFRAAGAMRGIGWVVLVYDQIADRLFNLWINEHDSGHLAGGIPLLVMDVFEHAFMLDYGLKKADYINAFWQMINWEIVEQRLT